MGKFDLSEMKEKVTSFAGVTGLKIKEASPEILLGLGIVTMGAAVVSGIMAARHHDEIISDHEERLVDAKAKYVVSEDSVNDEEEIEDSEKAEDSMVVVSDKEIARNVRKVYCRTAAKMVKLYAPTAALMAVSVACFVGMHNIQAGRIAGLTGAYEGLREAFNAYQQRNIELNGEENHQMCKYGWHEEEIEDENGEKKKVRVANQAKDLTSEEKDALAKLPFNDAVFTFNEETAKGSYTGSPNLDKIRIEAAENHVRQFVSSRGWATVNDALDALGMERTPEGMFQGWVKGCGPEVSFNLDDAINNRFLAGYCDEDIILDMNIHGNIYYELKKLEERKLKTEATVC